MRRAAHYQTLEFERMNRLLSELARGRSSPLQILDFGCGRGKFLKQIQGLGHRAVGVDANSAYVEEGWTAGFEVHLPEEFFTKPGRYDVVLLSHLVEHLHPTELIDLVPKLCGLLNEGGKLIVITPLFGERFFHDFSHIRPYYPQSLRHAFGQDNAPLLFGGVALIELTDIYFFRDPYRTRTWRSFYVRTSPLAPLTRALNNLFDLAWRISGGRIGAKASWLGVYRTLSPPSEVATG